MMPLCSKLSTYNINKYLESCVTDFKSLLNLKGNYKKLFFSENCRAHLNNIYLLNSFNY